MNAEQLELLDTLLARGADWPHVRVMVLGRWAWVRHPLQAWRLRRLSTDLFLARSRARARVQAKDAAYTPRLSRGQRDYIVTRLMAGDDDEDILDALELVGALRDLARNGMVEAQRVADIRLRVKKTLDAHQLAEALRNEAAAAADDIPTADTLAGDAPPYA